MNMVGISIGVLLSACFKNVTMASQIAPAVVVLLLLFSGFLLNEASIPVYFTWLKEISFIRYAFKATAVNEFQDTSFECDQADGGFCVTDGNAVLANLRFDQPNLIEHSIM